MKSIHNIPSSRVWKIAQSVIALSIAAAVVCVLSVRETPAATFTVTNTADLCLGVPCLDSLRKAIENANENPGADMIVFNIPGTGVKTILVTTTLGTITDSVFIDGWSQGGAGYSGPPLIEVTATGAGTGAGLKITTDNTTIRGLIINGFTTFTPSPPPIYGDGIVIDGDNNMIQGCYIGTTASGQATLPNQAWGIYIRQSSNNNLVGGVTVGARNVISGNGSGGFASGGVRVDGDGNSVIGNYIGVGADGFTDLGNYSYGIVITGDGNQIGGLPFGETARGNVISGNGDGGILIGTEGFAGNDNVIQANHIGVGANGTTPVSNTTGIVIDWGSGNQIGGVPFAGFEPGNIIAFNLHGGIRVGLGTRNRISANRIHTNGLIGGFNLLGIDLFSLPGYGITLNDACDLDEGVNNLQNFPLVTSALSFGGTTTIHGSLNSVPDITYSVEFFSNTTCNSSGHGEGRTYLGRTNASIIRPGCQGNFNVTFPEPVTPGHFITATATDPVGNTSEFSACRVVTASTIQFETSNFTINENGGTATVTVTRTGSTVSAATVEYATSSGTAAPRADYTETSGMLSFDIGQASKTFNVAIVDDGISEVDETINLGLQNVTGAGAALGSPATAILTILDNDGCSYAIDPTMVNSTASGGTGNVSVMTSGGCGWTAVSNALWLTVTGGASGMGNGTVSYSVAPNAGAARIGTVTIGGQMFTVNQAAGTLGLSPFDFDGDGKTDIGIFRTAVAEWWINRSGNGLTFAAQFGTTTDLITPADYTGDGKADIAIWRPSSGEWFVLRSEDFSFYAFPFGANGDTPAPADYDADGQTDAAVFRGATATWFIRRSSDGVTWIEAFGANGDLPVPADYDGDGEGDLAVFRPSNGQWWLKRSTGGVIATTFGNGSDKLVPGDYTGDGQADVAFWRPTTGEWFVLRSEDFSFFAFGFGTVGDIPAPGDYDGDGRHDATVFRPSNATWFSQRSTAGILIQQFGATGDRPIPNAFVP